MPAQVIVSASADDPGTAQLTWDHPLAAVAARKCQKHATILPDLLGGVACGACWSDAMFDDFMFAAENDLPIAVTVDPSYVDEIAVERAMRGEDLPLTALERREVNRRLAAARDQRNIASRFAFAQAGAAR